MGDEAVTRKVREKGDGEKGRRFMIGPPTGEGRGGRTREVAREGTLGEGVADG